MSSFRNRLAFVAATKDRPEDLRRMLASLAAQSCPPSQVVIVDASEEPVQEVAAERSALNVTYIRHRPPSATRQRNAGVDAVDRGIGLIGFLDDDAVLEPGATEAMLRFWEEAPADVGGAAFNWVNCPPRAASWLKASRLASWLGLYSKEKGVVMPSGWQTIVGRVSETVFVEWLPSGASVWRRAVLDEFRFDEWFDGYSYLEDVDFSYSVNRRYKLAVVAGAGFCHYPSPSGRLNAYRFGKLEVRNRLYLVRKHGLSVPRCYLGLIARMLLSMGRVITCRRPGESFRRVCGNLAGICRGLSRGQRDGR